MQLPLVILAPCIGGIVGIIFYMFDKFHPRRLFFTVEQDELVVLLTWGKAKRIAALPQSQKKKDRYEFPKLKVYKPGGPYFKWPWQEIKKASSRGRTVDFAGRDPSATPTPDSLYTRESGDVEAVTRDQLSIRLRGKITYQVSEDNIYAFLSGVDEATGFGGSGLQRLCRQTEL
ncbi:MAG: SPFH domain-containing protein, partial [Myxococcota bacterium]